MSNYITWLHLSDLHYCEPKTGWDASRVLNTLKSDLKRMLDDYGLQPDLIFFTGDAVFGQLKQDAGYNIRDQFEGVANFFEQVRTAFEIEIPRENFFIVPGNHDINREYVTEDQTNWLDSQQDENKIFALLQGKSLQWKRFVERLVDYRSFLERHGYSHLLQNPDNLTYTLTRSIRGNTINVYGLNSVWASSRDGEKGKLWMGGRWQIDNLLSTLPADVLSVVLMHHPSNWLVEHEDPHLSRQIERDFDFSLHGHEHQEWVTQVANHTRIAAGACYDRSDKSNGYNFVRINLDKGTGEVWLRRYHSSGGDWIPEIVPRKTNNDGLWPLSNLRQIALPPQLTPSNPLNDNTAEPPQSNTSLVDNTVTITFINKSSFRPYGSDLRPIVDAWVGREDELAALNRLENGIAVVTGIGGQGKSALVSKYLEGWIHRNPDGFWDWRDCREEGDSFHTQLVALIEHVTEGVISGKSLSGEDTKSIVRYFFQLVGDKKGVVILDNVDSYVNVSDEKFSLGVDIFVDEALRVKHNLIIILTCRPRISYANPRFLDVPLKGITLDQAIELFNLRHVKINQSTHKEIEEIWSLTEGHPLWLNLIAVQMFRNPQTAPNILQELRKGRIDDRTRSMFKALWKGLNSRQQSILRCMAEVRYPETAELIRDFVGSLIKSYNQFQRAFEGLKALSLVVERGLDSRGKKFDLHPLVRSFIRTEYPSQQERLPYIKPILLFFTRLITSLSEPSQQARLEDLLRWTAKAELELASNDSKAALETISRCSDRLVARGFHEEFFRVAKLILDSIDWNTIENQNSPQFHNVINHLISTLVEHHREDEARLYLKRYEISGGSSTVARLRVCKRACYVEWMVGDYDKAILLGREGVRMRKESGIDTEHDPSHTLALALRDSGQLDAALEIFAPDQTVEEILLEDHLNSGKNAIFYGNVGRCLQFKGQLAFALQCYVNSAELLQNSSDSSGIMNQGYAALWIGEVLEELGDYNSAYNFYSQAIIIWEKRAPIRVSIPREKRERVSHLVDSNCVFSTNDEVEFFCRDWLSKYRQSVEKKTNSV